MPSATSPITQLLKAWRAGDQGAFDRLLPLLYTELKKIARGYASSERPGASLHPTALVNEAYLRLVDADVDWSDRTHFFAVAARVMRRLLLDAARRRARAKRDGGGRAGQPFPLDEIPNLATARSRELIAVDDALAALARFDPRRAKVVELRFFGGLSVEETAAVLAVSPQTVLRDWRLARSWMLREMTQPSTTEPRSAPVSR